MSINLTTALAIFGMAIVTYATRIAGLWLMNRFTFSQPIKRWLNRIPSILRGRELFRLPRPTKWIRRRFFPNNSSQGRNITNF